MQKITYTVDNIIITGNYWPSANGKALILLHMMPATKESFTPFAEEAVRRGFGVLAIDLRGHGESTDKIHDGMILRINYSEFSDREHQDSMNDVQGARDWLAAHGISADDVAIGGASIGANFAIKYMSENPTCPAGFVLSAGLNYHGVETERAARSLSPHQHLFIAAAKDDERAPGAREDAERIYSETGADKKIRLYETGGHGTTLFESHPECMEDILAFLSAHV